MSFYEISKHHQNLKVCKAVNVLTFDFTQDLDNNRQIWIDVIGQPVNQGLHQLRSVGGKNGHVITWFVLKVDVLVRLELNQDGGATMQKRKKGESGADPEGVDWVASHPPPPPLEQPTHTNEKQYLYIEQCYCRMPACSSII